MRHARPKRLLGAEMSPEERAWIDARLAVLGRGVGAMRLRIGEGLSRLEAVGGVHELGFPNLDSYCREALGRSGRWGADARSLARRLSGLPGLRAALVEGRLTSSMVELIARVATDEDEDRWIVGAVGSTVRAMRQKVNTAQAQAAANEDDPDVREGARVTLCVTADRVDAWAFEQARMMVEAVGAAKGDGAIEAMLAEGVTELLEVAPGLELPEGLGEHANEAARAWRAELARLREEGEVVCEAGAKVAHVSCEVLPEVKWPEDALGIDGALRGAARELAWRDMELAALARRCFESELWLRFGWASFEQYCRERVGLSASSVTTRVTLSRRVGELPEIEAAVGEGRVGYEAATLIARVGGPRTVAAWIERAEARTVKLLRQEVEAVEMVARADGKKVEEMAPPDGEVMDQVRGIERAVIGALSGAIQMSGGGGGAIDELDGVGLPTRTLKLSMSEETARFWRVLEAVHARLWVDDSFLTFLARAVMKAWRGARQVKDEYGDVYLRERWRCASPVCESRNVTPHHVTFRSRGGGEERGNLVAVCEICHLKLIHGGRLSVRGVAPGALEWKALGWAA